MVNMGDVAECSGEERCVRRCRCPQCEGAKIECFLESVLTLPGIEIEMICPSPVGFYFIFLWIVCY